MELKRKAKELLEEINSIMMAPNAPMNIDGLDELRKLHMELDLVLWMIDTETNLGN